jgi:YbbR domain-containing protein
VNKRFYLVLSILFSFSIWIGIALSENYFVTITLPLKVIDIPENFSASSNIPQQITLKIKAEGWKLLPFEFGKKNYFYISAKNDSTTFTQDLYSSLEINPWFDNTIKIIEILPKKINVQILKKVEKTIKVKPLIDLKFKKGFGLASNIIVIPDSILIKGPVKEIDFVKEIETIPVKLFNLDKKTEIICELNSLYGFENEVKSVKIVLDVQRIIENTITEIPIKIRNLPENINVLLIPTTIDLTLKGGIDYFIKFNRNEVSAFTDYNEIIKDTLGYIKPEIIVPTNFTLISYKPEIIKYIIKKY